KVFRAIVNPYRENPKTDIARIAYSVQKEILEACIEFVERMSALLERYEKNIADILDGPKPTLAGDVKDDVPVQTFSCPHDWCGKKLTSVVRLTDQNANARATNN